VPPLSDEELARWAQEHLVYEVRMFAYAAIKLDERRDMPRDHESNVLLEVFAVHTRCLMEFFWGCRRNHQMDAFAADFCDGDWPLAWDSLPSALASVERDKRLGREVVHLSYERSNVPSGAKDWPISEIVEEIVEVLFEFINFANRDRLDADTLEALQFPLGKAKVGPQSVATGIVQGYTGGTIEVSDFTTGS
jgi:hypothetical protein